MMTYTATELAKLYDRMTASAVVKCRLTTELVGGLAADEPGIRAFAEHHLKLAGEALEQAVTRILTEEIGERKMAMPEDEVPAKGVYSVSIIRRTEHGPWLGNWMIKACLKAAASRIGLFVSKRGVKGDMAEMGLVAAMEDSLREPAHPERIYLIAPEATGLGPLAAPTYFRDFRGRVQTPQGAVSIVSHKECVPPGTCFSFRYRWYDGRLGSDDVASIFAAAQNIGLGSAKAFECGKFVVERLEIERLGNQGKAG